MSDQDTIKKRKSYRRFSKLYDTLVESGLSPEHATIALHEFFAFCDKFTMFGSRVYASICEVSLEQVLEDKLERMAG